jgi:hypothetical protein
MICFRCKKEKSINNFYIVRSGKRKGKIQSYCKSCNKKNVVDRLRNFKQKLVDYKGGKCKICGYDKCVGALDLHHRDPSKKNFTFSHIKMTSFEKNKNKICQELDKCDLLCANCHREIHFYTDSNL